VCVYGGGASSQGGGVVVVAARAVRTTRERGGPTSREQMNEHESERARESARVPNVENSARAARRATTAGGHTLLMVDLVDEESRLGGIEHSDVGRSDEAPRVAVGRCVARRAARWRSLDPPRAIGSA
jgi:hypothetical protein